MYQLPLRVVYPPQIVKRENSQYLVLIGSEGFVGMNLENHRIDIRKTLKIKDYNAVCINTKTNDLVVAESQTRNVHMFTNNIMFKEKAIPDVYKINTGIIGEGCQLYTFRNSFIMINSWSGAGTADVFIFNINKQHVIMEKGLDIEIYVRNISRCYKDIMQNALIIKSENKINVVKIKNKSNDDNCDNSFCASSRYEICNNEINIDFSAEEYNISTEVLWNSILFINANTGKYQRFSLLTHKCYQFNYINIIPLMLINNDQFKSYIIGWKDKLFLIYKNRMTQLRYSRHILSTLKSINQKEVELIASAFSTELKFFNMPTVIIKLITKFFPIADHRQTLL